MARIVRYFDAVVHQKPISDTEKMQYLKTSLTGQAKAAISGMGFSYNHTIMLGIYSVRSMADQMS